MHHAVLDGDIAMLETLCEKGASTAIRTKCDRRNVLDMTEDLVDARRREAFLAAVRRPSLRH